jgi:hypothetical protein
MENGKWRTKAIRIPPILHYQFSILHCAFSLLSLLPLAAQAQVAPPRALRIVAQPIVDARDYGVVAGDGRGDGAALTRAVEAAKAAGGGVVQLPPGVLNVWHIKLDHLKGITLRGRGATGAQATTLVRQRSRRAPDRERILTIRDTSDFVMADMAIDMNRQQWYGGVGVYRCTRCRFERLRLYDSHPYPYVNTPDRYALVFGFGGRDAPHEDLVIRHNRIEDLQLEVDHARRVQITENYLIRGDFTAALGSFGLGSGYIFEDVEIARNRIVNASRQATALQLDFRATETVHDVVFRRIRIEDNVVIYHPTVRQAPSLTMRLGMHNNSLATPGTVYQDITVADNAIYLAPGVPHRAAPLIFGNVSGRSGWRWQGLTVTGNTLYAAQPRRLLDVRRVPGDDVTITGNTTQPYRTPPKAPWPAEGAP